MAAPEREMSVTMQGNSCSPERTKALTLQAWRVCRRVGLASISQRASRTWSASSCWNIRPMIPEALCRTTAGIRP
jgi:hypothetical protein